MTSCSKLLVTFVFIFLLLQLSIPSINAEDDDLVTVSITEAENALSSSYEVVLSAEQFGANVSALLNDLNVCGKHLAEAYVYYRSGDSDNANYFANLCSDLSDDIKTEANELLVEAQKSADAEFVSKVFGSVVGVFVVVIFGFVSWNIFKRNYHRRILKLRPKVVSDGF